jgi:hypothetical protein
VQIKRRLCRLEKQPTTFLPRRSHCPTPPDEQELMGDNQA